MGYPPQVSMKQAGGKFRFELIGNCIRILKKISLGETFMNIKSDNWLVDELGFTDLFNQLLPTMPWNTVMDTMMKEMHAQGKNIDDIVEVLKRTPIHPRIVSAIKSAYAIGCELKIVSDANMFYIETILDHLGVKECFSEIYSNPGFVDEEGKLRILPYHDFNKASHGCKICAPNSCKNVCPPNMCKGMIIEKIQASLEGKKKIIYLGDGAGDYCPSVRLGKGDYLMPRKNFPVWDLICKNPLLIKAEIHEWSDGEELEQVLLELINMISVEENNENSAQLITVDCKLQTISASKHSLPRSLPVPQ